MPKNAENYYQLGLAFVGNRDLQSAFNSFRKTLELDPKHARAQMELSRIMATTLDSEMLQDAEKRLTDLLQGGFKNPDALSTLALAQLKLGKMEAAVENLQQALIVAPQALQSSILLARAKLAQHDFKAAEEVLRTACSSAPKSSEARVILGDFYLSRERAAEAEEQFRGALTLNPDSAFALMEMGKLQIYLGRKQDAEQTLRRLSLLPDPSTRAVHAVFLLQEGRKEEAIQEFKRIAGESPESSEARTALVAAYIAIGQKAEASRVLETALKKNTKDLNALLQRGEIYLQDGKYGLAEADLNRVLYLRPNSAEVHYILSRLQQARGSFLLQRQELAEALRLDPTLLPVRLELVQALLDTKAAKSALEVLDEAPPHQRRLLRVVIQRNWALWGLGDLGKLRQGIDAGLQVQRAPDLLIQDGLWKLRNGDPAGARKVLEEALKVDPADVRALQVMNQTYIAQKQASGALRRVQDYAAQQPKSAPLQDFLGMMLLATGYRKEARVAFAAAKAADLQYSKADLSLVQLDVTERRLDDARNTLQALVVKDTGNLTAQLWLGNIEEMRGNHAAATDQFRKVVALNPGDAQASNNLAYLLTEYRNQPDEALKYAEKALEIAPENPAYCDTLGWALYRKGLYSAAIPYLERASTNKENAVWKYHLAMAYAKSGDRKRSRTTLDAALKLDSKVPEAKVAQELLGGSR
jgi:Tfp pilus assembly protein PilF